MEFRSIFFILAFLILVSEAIAQEIGDLNLSSTYEAKPVNDEMKYGNRYLSINGLGGVSGAGGFNSGLWSLTGQVGYFAAKRLAAGVQISYGQDFLKKKDSGTVFQGLYPNERRISTLDPQLFLRYYLFQYKVKPFFQLATGVNYQWGSQSNDSGGSNSVNSLGFNAGGAVGAAWLASRKVSIEASYNRKLTKTEYNDANDITRFRLGISVFLH